MAGAAGFHALLGFPVVALRAEGAVVAPGAIAHVLRESDVRKVGAADLVGRSCENARQRGARVVVMDLVDHHFEIHRRVGCAGDPRARVMAAHAQLGIDAGAVRRQLIVALVAGGGEHDITRREAATGRHEIVGAGRLGIRAVRLLDRHAVREVWPVADVQGLAVGVRARRRAGIRRGIRDIGGESVGVAAVPVIGQSAEGVARG